MKYLSTKIIQTRAERGDSDAQTELGQRYYYSCPDIAQDYHEALRWFMKASEHGNTAAQNCLGEMYLYGHGVVRDFHQAMRWFNKAFEQGDAEGQVNLATLYLSGRGVQQNPEKSLHLCRELAEQGHARAQLLLSHMYLVGLGMAKNPKEALVWLTRATEQGDSQAEFELGFRYIGGIDVNKDRDQAGFWFNRGAEHADIANLYATLHNHLKSQRLAEADAVTQSIIRHVTGRQRIDSEEAAKEIPPEILFALDHWWWALGPSRLAERPWISKESDFSNFKGFFSVTTWFEWILKEWGLA
jgi:TPR repeat protein